MITPTLFDVAGITGLWPICETFDPNIKNKIKASFSFNHHNFNAYMKYHHEQTEEVPDSEHISFLTLWLSHFIFYSSFIQVAKTFIPLEIQLHEGENVYLSKLILGSLYESLGLSSLELKNISSFDENS